MVRESVNRRTILKATAATGAAGIAGCLGGDDEREYVRPIDIDLDDVEPENEVNMWNWFYDFRDWTVEEFSAEYGIEDSTSTGYSSAAEWYSRLESGSHAIDHVGSTGNYTVRSVENDFFEPLPVDQFEGWEALPDFLQDAIHEYAGKDGEVYAMPQSLLLYPTLTYNEEHFSSPPDSWGVLWDEEYAGDITMWDEAQYPCQIAALYTGQDPFDPDDLDEIQEVLEQQIDLNETLWDEYNHARGLFINEDVVVGPLLDGQTYIARFEDEAPINYTIPEEGGLYQLDDMAIPADCPNPRAATMLMDWVTQPSNLKNIFHESGYPPAIDHDDFEELYAEDLEEGTITQEEIEFFRWGELEDRLMFAEPLSDDILQTYDQIWTEVKN